MLTMAAATGFDLWWAWPLSVPTAGRGGVVGSAVRANEVHPPVQLPSRRQTARASEHLLIKVDAYTCRAGPPASTPRISSSPQPQPKSSNSAAASSRSALPATVSLAPPYSSLATSRYGATTSRRQPASCSSKE